jgi:hypothetical protein
VLVCFCGNEVKKNEHTRQPIALAKEQQIAEEKVPGMNGTQGQPSPTEIPFYDQDFNFKYGYAMDYDYVSGRAEDTGRQFYWYRYRIRLSTPLPFDLDETYLRVEKHSTQINKNGNNYNAPTTVVVPVTLHIAAGQTTGDWAFSTPEAGEMEAVDYSLVQIPITLRSNPNKLAPPAAEAMFTPAPENVAHNNIVNNVGVDRLGKLPMGMGRAGDPGGAGNAYAAPVEVYATVPDIPSITWKWKRSVKTAYWRVRLNRPVPGGPVVMQGTQLGGHVVANDDPFASSSSVIRSSNGRIYTADSSAVDLSSVAGSLVVGDFYYEERQFEYWLQGTFNGSVFEIGRTKVAQIITMQRSSVTGTLANDFWGGKNYNFIGEVDLVFSNDEVKSLVGSPYPTP